MIEALRTPLYSYVRARSALYSVESLLGPLLDGLLTRKRPRLPTDDRELFTLIRARLFEILKRDVDHIAKGIYPLEVLKPGSAIDHLRRMPAMLFEGLRIARRRQRHASHEFSPAARDLMQDLPDYYRRNFHYQGDGYLSEQSARLYEHQVDILFAGSADAMRRLLLPTMKLHFQYGDGEGLRFLELGAGTGRATRFVRMAFPKAKIVAIDLSGPYLKRAQHELKSFQRHDFLEADAADLPFLDENFDAVYSVFLFHELPLEVRHAVMNESSRVLKPRGYLSMIDSLQLGDVPPLDAALKRFPVDFHEPFYRNYIEHPAETLFEKIPVTGIKSETGFLAKAVSARKVIASTLTK